VWMLIALSFVVGFVLGVLLRFLWALL